MMLTKCKKFEKDLIDEEVIFEKDNQIKIIKHYNGGYGFEIKNKVFTSDIMEGISYLMKNPKLYDNQVWSLNIELDKFEISPASSLYWLSGGDEFWENPEYDINWKDYFQLYLDNFESILCDIINDVKTLGGLKDRIQKDLNLDVFYEFSLDNDII